MGKRIGNKCKVTLGANQVVAIGSWSLNGIQADQVEVTALGDDWKSFMFGLKDGGDVTFDGFYDPDDSTGQEVLRLANLNNNNVTQLRLYIDNTSYFTPCQTTGYFSPANSTGAPTRLSYLNITSYDVKADKAGVMQSSFKAKVSGCMVLV